MTSPFVTGPNSHQRFSPRPVSLASGTMGSPAPSTYQSPSSSLKPPKAPERPLVPYMRFSKKIWHRVRDENPDCALWDIGRKVGEIWRDLPASEKRIYQEEFAAEKVEYDKAMKAYQNSPAYQSYLAQKNLLEQQKQRAAAAAAPAPLPPSQPSPAPLAPAQRERQHHQLPGQQQAVRLDHGIFIQPVDEDDGEGLFSRRKLAGQRYERNHRLMGELFSDLSVPDTRNITTKIRIEQLRKQSVSLAVHKEKLENELKSLEDKFQAKKRNIEEGSQKFAQQLKKVCQEQPVLDTHKYESMVETATERLLAGYERFKKRQEEMAAAARRAEEASRAATASAAPMPVVASASVPTPPALAAAAADTPPAGQEEDQPPPSSAASEEEVAKPARLPNGESKEKDGGGSEEEEMEEEEEEGEEEDE